MWLWLVPLLLMMTWLGARGLNADAYWLDETWSLYSAGAAQYGPLSPADIWTRTATEDFGGPGYHFLLAAWGALVGWTPFAARASSLLLGALALAWVYRLGRDMAAPLVGISAAVLFGGSAFTLYFLHELRTYVLSVLLVAFVLWAYWRLAVSPRRPGWALQVSFVLGVAGLLYTHYYLALILPVIGVYHVLLAPKGTAWWRVVGLMALGGLLFLPWLSVVLAALSQFSTAEAGAREPALSAAQLMERTVLFFSSGAGGLFVIVLALALGSLRVYRRQSIAAWCWALLALVVLIAVNERTALIKPGRERYLLLAWPPLALLGGMGIASLSRSRFRLLIPVLLAAWLVVGGLAALDGTLMRDTDGAQALPWNALADTLRQQAQPGDVVAAHLTAYNWVLDLRPLEYYLYGLPVRFTALESLPAADFPQAARGFVDEAAAVWLAIDKRLPASARLDEFTAALAGSYASCGTVFDLPRLRLDVYRRFPAQAFDPAQSAVLRFGQGVALTYADISQTGGTLKTRLLWAVGADVPPYTYSVGLHVLDAAGTLVAQADYGLPLEAFACRETAIPTGHLPPGEYQLLALVYNWSTGERLVGEVVAAGETGERLELGRFQVDG